MIRFVDLTKQISLDEENAIHQFAWFNTVNDRFLEFSGNQSWSEWADFCSDWVHGGGEAYKLVVFKALLPNVWLERAGYKSEDA